MMFTALLMTIGATQTFEMSAFDRVASAVSADVQIDVDPSASGLHQVVVEGDQEDIDRLEIEVKNGRLEIGSENRGWGNWTMNSRMRIRTTVKSLKEIALAGSGDTVARGLRGNAFKVKASGSGDIELAGEIGDLTVSIAGSGDIEAATVDASTVTIKIAGSGSVEVAGRANTLTAKIAGSGDIDASKLSVTDATAKVMGSGDVKVCASGTVDHKSMGSGDIENVCD